jgi:hypothetical protein
MGQESPRGCSAGPTASAIASAAGPYPTAEERERLRWYASHYIEAADRLAPE